MHKAAQHQDYGVAGLKTPLFFAKAVFLCNLGPMLSSHQGDPLASMELLLIDTGVGQIRVRLAQHTHGDGLKHNFLKFRQSVEKGPKMPVSACSWDAC